MKIKGELFERDGYVRYYALVDGRFYFWVDCANAWVSSSELELIAELYRMRKAYGQTRMVTLKGRIVL